LEALTYDRPRYAYEQQSERILASRVVSNSQVAVRTHTQHAHRPRRVQTDGRTDGQAPDQ